MSILKAFRILGRRNRERAAECTKTYMSLEPQLQQPQNLKGEEYKPLDSIHHIAIQVNDIQKAIDWYQAHLNCTVAYQDATWGLLKFANLSLALVLPGDHPPHLGIPCEHPEQYGEVKPHRDGTVSSYITDPFGNAIEMIKLTTNDFKEY